MNCVNHPEAAVTAFCQNCGKGLCAQCSREVQGNVFCEPCLAARVCPACGNLVEGDHQLSCATHLPLEKTGSNPVDRPRQPPPRSAPA